MSAMPADQLPVAVKNERSLTKSKNKNWPLTEKEYKLLSMRVLMLYRQRSEHARRVEEYVRDLTKRHSDRKIDLMDVDTREGISTASLYDVMRYPAILALTNDGQVLKQWQGDTLPLMDEVVYYSN